MISAQLLTGDKAWPLVLDDLDWFINNGKGKKMYFDEACFIPRSVSVFPKSPQNGWPSVTSEGVQPNSPNAVADVSNEHVSTSHHLTINAIC